MTKQKLRQFPLEVGSGSAMVSVFEPEVADLSRDLLRSFGYRGLANIEFKRDARDGIYRLIEVNPRSSNANQLAVSAGVDFPFLVYRYLTRPDEPEAPSAGFRVGVTWVHEDLDLQAFLALRKTGELTLAEWVGSLRGPRSWAVFSLRDPAPFLFQVSTHLAGRVRKTVRGSRSRGGP
jgi:predicted ATP-grasp superfamily ATP-dependent carboligase